MTTWLFITQTIITLILAGLAIYLFIKLKQSSKAKDSSHSQFKVLENKVNSLQLQTLESRLNPHLLKNILNSIQSHAYQTYFALDKLANVLDYILYESRNRLVSPKEEIEFAMSLIEINKIKLSPLFELKVKTRIDEEDEMYHREMLAPLISIDLIENAFKHADIQNPDAFISILFEFSNGMFSLTVSNKISQKTPIPKRKRGIGTETLDQRLKIIYKDAFTLDRFTEGDVYIAHLKINLLEHKVTLPVTG
jgi:sensor histidine kinase YesM